MRFAPRIMIGLGAATVLAVGVPTAASASTAPATAAATTKTESVSWGPFSSTDGKAKAEGKVTVEKKAVKVKYWKKYWTWEKKCWWKDGDRVCKKFKEWHRKRVVKWVKYDLFTVDSTLTNHKWGHWSPRRHSCAWELFKVEKKNGDVASYAFVNCGKGSKEFTFTVKDASKIWVDVARGNAHAPKSRHSGLKAVYPSV